MRPRLECLEDRTLLSANVYTVNVATDTNTNGVGIGLTGDLRYCINQADNPDNVGSTIQFDSSLKGQTIHLTQGELAVSDNMTIDGGNAPGLTISGNPNNIVYPNAASRIFDVKASAVAVIISNLTITDGNAAVYYTTIAGNQGGDIYNGGNLTLKNDVVENGFSLGNASGPGRGGAIFNAEGSSGNTGASLTLDNTTVKFSTAEGFDGANAVSQGQAGGAGGAGYGGGVYNDTNATLIVENGSQILSNKALGGNGGSGSGGGNGGSGGAGGAGAAALGGGLFNAGTLEFQGSSTSSNVIADNTAKGGAGNFAGNGGSGGNGPIGTAGGKGGDGGAGGLAAGGGVYNTGTLSWQYVQSLGDQAVGGNGGNSGNGGSGGNGTTGQGGVGGTGGAAGVGGGAQGGGLYNGSSAKTLTLANSLFGVDAGGVGNQAIGGVGGTAGTGGTAGSSKAGNAVGGNGGIAGDGGAAEGGAAANAVSALTFTNTSFTSNRATGGGSGKGGGGGTGGSASSGMGGKGGAGSAGGTAGAADGGAVFSQSGDLSFTNDSFTDNHASGGAASNGNGGGVAGGGGANAKGGAGGSGGAGGAGGGAGGGAVFGQGGNLSITSSSFAGNVATGGPGGNAGAGNTGGAGGVKTSKAAGGIGGSGGIGGGGGSGGAAQGGGFYNLIGTVSVSSSSFQADANGIGNQAISGGGGTGGIGGNGGQSGTNNGGVGGVGGIGGAGGAAAGGAGENQGGDTTLTNDTFTSSLIETGNGDGGGNGGNGGGSGSGGIGGKGGDGGSSGPAWGGALAVTASNLTVSASTFGGDSAALGNTILGGAGGNGGIGGTIGVVSAAGIAGNGGQGGAGVSVYGGALSAAGNTQTINISGSTFANNALTSGNGGNGGQAGLFSFDGQNGGINGQGGNGGLAQGGAISLSASTAQSATLQGDTIASNSASGGAGGAGAINHLGSIGLLANSNGYGSAGGSGGAVEGVGLAAVNYNLNVASSSFDSGKGVGGMGGAGGGASVAEPKSFAGGAGGAGGTVQGGGVFLSNSLATTPPLNFSLNGDSATSNALTGGAGGNGGNAGASGSRSVAGGAGGAGGRAQGGGVYIGAGANSVNASSLDTLTLNGNQLSGGAGGLGGAGYNATGGKGGDADGGGVYSTSANTTAPSSLSFTDSVVYANQASGGTGGNAGSSTTINGGAGGVGGGAGNAYGGGFYDGANTPLTVINTTFGGGSTDSGTPDANANILFGGGGGGGGNAGTPAGVTHSNGGGGGGGGNVEGGNVYSAANSTATFLNDTLVFGQAVSFGLGGAGGSGAGSGGQPGPAGTTGTAAAGGYFAVSGSSDTIGNTILALNNAVIDADAAGTFASAGNNLLSSTSGTTGFGSTDKTVTAAQLNLGALSNNGGPTLTDALGADSVAFDAGNNALVPFDITTDQRGPGFVRIYNRTVDVGAFEFQLPISSSFSPNNIVEGSPALTLTITGTNFEAGATVSFGGTILTPSSISSNQLKVTVPASLLTDDGEIYVTVNNPDGSGMVGTFAITEAPFNLNNPGPQSNNAGDAVKLTLTPAPPDLYADGFSATGLPPGLTIDANTGVISGNIAMTAGGTYNVTVTGHDGTLADNISFNWVVTPFTLVNPGNQTNNEGDTVSLTIKAASGFTAGDFSATGLPTSLSINTNTGVISGTIGAYAAGSYNVTVNAIDNDAPASVSFTWVVNDTTPPALTNPGKQSNNAGDTVNVTITAQDADAGSFTASGLPPGLTIDANSGIISGTIASTAGGIYNVTVSARDGGITGNTSFVWNVTPFTLVNPGEQTNNESATVSLTISAASGFSASGFSASGLPAGLSISSAGVISGTINAYAAGSYNVIVSANDNGAAASVTFTWVVNDTTPPALTNPGTQNSNAGQTVNLAIGSVDADAGSFTATGLPTGLNINASTGVISGTIAMTAGGTYNVTVGASDGSLPSSTSFQWVVTPSTLTNPGTQINNEGDTVSLTIQPFPGFTASNFSAASLPPGLTVNTNTGVITGTIGVYTAGSYNVTVDADYGSFPASTTFTWVVNDHTPPSLTNPGTQNSNAGQTVNLTIASQDADPGSITATGLPPGLSINATSGAITGTINSSAGGTYSVTVSATDGPLQSSISFNWIVTPSSLTNPGTQTNNEGDTVSLTIQPFTGFTASGFTISGQPTGLSINASTGLISGTIGAYAAGSYNVTVDASYGSFPASTTFTWVVNDTTPPSLTNPGTQTSNAGQTVNLTIASVDADANSITATGLPPGLSINATSGVISGTINPTAGGTYSVTVGASDGILNGSTSFQWVVTPFTLIAPATQINNEGDTASLTISAAPGFTATGFSATGLPTGLSINASTGAITGAIDPRGAGTYTVSVSAGDNGATASITFQWLVTDTTPPALTNPGNQINIVGDKVELAIQAVDADAGSFTATNLPQGLSIDADTGVISGTISSLANGFYNVIVSASDSGNASSTSFQWVVPPSILVNPGAQTNNEGGTVSLTISAASGFTASGFSATGLPSGLSINASTGVISGIINAYAAGTYNATVTANDNGVPSNVNFTWVVNDTTPPSLTNPGTLTNAAGNTVNLVIAAVDADAGSFTATGLPTGLSINAQTGVISGTIDPKAAGTYNVTVGASDGGNASNTSFNWVVTPFALLNPGTQTNNEGDTVSLTISAASGFTASGFSATGLPTGLSINASTGVISGAIAAYAANTYNVTVTANYSGGLASTTFTWVVNDTTPPTLTNPGNQSNSVGQTVNLAIQAVDADAGSFTATGLPPGLSINAQTGVISGTIAASATGGSYSVTVQAADGAATSNVTFLWTVASSSGGGTSSGGQTTTIIVSVQNTYPGFVQMETVTVDVTNAAGLPVDEGVATFQVDGQTVVAPVHNGVAVATIATSLFDFGLLYDLLFQHPLSVNYSDNGGSFGASNTGTVVPSILIDYFLSLLAAEIQQLEQFRVV